jgi:catalase
LISALSFELSHCDDHRVYKSYTQLLNNIDHDLAKAVAISVNGVIPDQPARQNHGKKDPTLSQTFYLPKIPTIATRRIAILIDDGFNAFEVEAVRAILAAEKAKAFVIGSRRGKIHAEAAEGRDGAGVVAHHHFEGQRSTLYDALYIPSGEHGKALMTNGRVIHWIREAFGHCKAIAAVGEGQIYSYLR